MSICSSPNLPLSPFYNCTSSTLVSSSPELHLVDGGEALQNNPIWPFLHRSSVDVLIVNDNSADTSASYPNESTSASYPDESTSANYPNGTELITTYVQAVSAGLTRMPVNPSVDTFISQGLNVRPTFFGCNAKGKMTIVYLPNTNYTYNSGQSTAKLEYTEAETRAMIGNGVQIGSFGGSATWAGCLGCGIMAKSGVTLPKTCKTCLAEFCYN
jgi:lysophospholipase